MNANAHIKNVDIVFMNWVLHHLTSSSYRKTQKTISQALLKAKSLLKNKESSFISICEIMYDGIIFDNMPSHIIYHLSTSKILAPLMKSISTSANVAGTGVFFLSRKQWEKIITGVDLKIIKYTNGNPIKFPLYQKAFLHLGKIRHAHFWVSS